MVTEETRAYRVIGTRPVRHDGVDKVTGRARYGADISVPGMLHGAVLRSPYAHARIMRINLEKALAHPGVKAVVTAADFTHIMDQAIDYGELLSNTRVLAGNMLAHDKALYRGHAVAAVAAVSRHVAEEALSLIEVEYEILPPVLNVRDAMHPDSPVVHDRLTTRRLVQRFARGDDTGVTSNVASHLRYQHGDVEAGFARADVIVEREFTTSSVHQGYIEPHTATALWKPDGRLTIWTSSQGGFGIRGQTAALLGIPESIIKIEQMEIGGGFGGKLSPYLEPLAAVLSRKSGRAVKISMSRHEVFEASGPAPGTYMRAKIGATRDGTLTAAQLYLVFEAGAFPGSPVGAAAATALAPYRLENMLVDGYDVVVNKPKVAAYRAPGAPQAAFAVETLVDELADKLGIDPLAFRLENAASQGDRLASGVSLPAVGCRTVLEAMQAHPHYTAPLEGPGRGRGVAVGFWSNYGGPSAVTMTVNADGTVSLITGSVDIGGSRPVLAMHAAEVLGIRAEDVVPSVVNTDAVGWTGMTNGSRIAFSSGIAVVNASQEVAREMAARAAVLWQTTEDDVELRGGAFIRKSSPADRLSFAQVAAKLLQTGGPVTVSATSNPSNPGPAYAGLIVDVDVDTDTGKVGIRRCTAIQDVGRAIHPDYVEGQMQGGTAQGIGWALNEAYEWDDTGRMLNASFLDYRMPTALDLPAIDTVMVEEPNPTHPFGARGVGEAPIIAPPAAIANAVYRATGIRFTHLPMSPRHILEALLSGGQE